MSIAFQSGAFQSGAFQIGIAYDESLSLDASAGIVLSSLMSMLSDISLSINVTVAPSSSGANLVSSLLLGNLVNIGLSSQQGMSVNVSLASSVDIQSVGKGDLASYLNLDSRETIAASNTLNANDSLSFGNQVNIALTSKLDASEMLSLANSLGFSTASQMVAYSTVTLSILAGLQVDSTVEMQELLVLAALLRVILGDGAASIYEEALDLLVSLGMNVSNANDINESIEFQLVNELTTTAGLTIEEAVTLTAVLSMLDAAQQIINENVSLGVLHCYFTPDSQLDAYEVLNLTIRILGLFSDGRILGLGPVVLKLLSVQPRVEMQSLDATLAAQLQVLNVQPRVEMQILAVEVHE